VPKQQLLNENIELEMKVVKIGKSEKEEIN